MLLNNEWADQEIKEEIKIKKHTETNETNKHNGPNLWNAAKADLRGKVIAIQAYLKKQEKFQIHNLTLYVK